MGLSTINIFIVRIYIYIYIYIYTARRLLKENGRRQAEKNAQSCSAGIYCFVAIDMSRDLAHTCFTHAHLKSNWRALVLVTLKRQPKYDVLS